MRRAARLGRAPWRSRRSAAAGRPRAPRTRSTVYAAASLTERLPAGLAGVPLPVRGLEPARPPDPRAVRRRTCSPRRARSTRRSSSAAASSRSRAPSRRTRSCSRSRARTRRRSAPSQDLAKRPKLKLVVAGAKVPIGLYTREVLKRLGLLRVLRKAVSQEPDVKGIVGKLALGEADAGFVYATDVRAASSRLIAIPLPAALTADRSVRGRGREGDGEPGRRARVRRRPARRGREARAQAGGLRPSVRSPFGVGARARDRRRPRLPPAADRRDLPPDPAGPPARRHDEPGGGRRARSSR